MLLTTKKMQIGVMVKCPKKAMLLEAPYSPTIHGILIPYVLDPILHGILVSYVLYLMTCENNTKSFYSLGIQ
jgi:hypothetical protein